MATIKYKKREFTPNQNQDGMTHSWYAESVIVNELNSVEISKLIEARTGVRRYEAQSVLASFVELINEECSQSMRVKLTDEKGQKFLSIYPKISGSISDKDIQANPQKYENRQTALESDLTADMLTVTLAATVGINASKTFSENASIQKVSAAVAGVADEDEESTGGQQTGGNGSNTNGNDNTGGSTGGSTGGDNGGGGSDPNDPENDED